MKLSRATLLLLTACLSGGSARAADYGAFLDAQFAASQGLLDMAASRMMTALRADPGSVQLHNDAFALALLAGRHGEAAELAQGVPGNPAASLIVADTRARAGDWQGAELLYAELPQQGPTELLRPLLVAWSQQAQGLTDRALATLQPALSGQRAQGVFLLHAALIADAAHRDGLAARLFDVLAKAEPQPSLALVQVLAGWQARSGDMARAQASIDAAIHAAPELAIARPRLLAALAHSEPLPPRTAIAQAYVAVAAELRAQNAPDFAALLVQLAAGMEPRLALAHLVASELDVARKQPGQAADELARIGDDDPLAPVVQLRRATLDERAGRPEAAATLLRRLTDAYPTEPTPLVQLGDLLSTQKKYADAIGLYDRAIALVRHPTASDWSLFYARGAALERQHEWPRAEADMNRALELQPDQPFVLNFLGFAWADRNENLPEARAMIERAMAQRPNDGAIIDSFGWVLLRQGEKARAVRMLEHAVELEPDDGTITGHLGDAYWSVGRRAEAEDQWRRALVLKPDAEDAARIEERLRGK